jgi:class 3 adenylate cyclase/plasmid stabilization system protein ParE
MGLLAKVTRILFMGWLDQLSIKSKLIAMLLAVSGCSILVTAYLGYRSGQANLTERVFAQLTSVRASKANQIESYFQTIRAHLETLGETPSMITAMDEFTENFNRLQDEKLSPAQESRLIAYYRQEFLPRLTRTEKGTPVLETFLPRSNPSRYLQYHYIAANPYPVGKKDSLIQAPDGSEYSQTHARYHPFLRSIIQKFGYYDLFLIDPSGNIVYTVYKETDFASNLTTGAYNESNLARLVREVRRTKEKNYARIIDFEAYIPSYGAPAAFIAIPLFQDANFIGTLAVQLPVDQINKVMTGNQQWERDGLGKTGETYLVGPDFLMRSVSRFLIETPVEFLQTLRSLGVDKNTIERIRQYQTSILEQKVKTQAVENALIGQQGTRIMPDYRNIPVLSSYAPLNIDGLDWVILAEMDLAEAYAPIDSFGRQLLLWATLLMIVVTLLAMALAARFVRPIARLMEMSRRIQGGQAEEFIPLESQDEFGELSRSFSKVVEGLRSQTYLVEEKNRENEHLLLSIFPPSIAKRLKRGEEDIAENIANVAVLFADLTGFSALLEQFTAKEIVSILNDLVSAFDEAAERFGIEKIKTIGDSYLAVCGLSVPYLDADRRSIDLAQEMLSIVRLFNHERSLQLNLGIGISTGNIIAGIVGRNRFVYDVWGQTINEVSTIKLACDPGEILVSESIYRRLGDIYEFEGIKVTGEYRKEPFVAWRIKQVRSSIAVQGTDRSVSEEIK